MNPFDVLIVQPIFNLLLGFYLLVGDFGVAIILLSVLVRLALWPLLRRQLHQTTLMRSVQPELKKIKAKTKGNTLLERQLMMELYKERGIRPFGPILILAIQIPILLALYTVIRIITTGRDQIASFTYPFLKHVGRIEDILANHQHFSEKLFGLVDLTQVATHSWPILVFALLTALFQYIQSKQILPQSTSNRRLRDIMKDSAAGKETDQSEISAVMSQRMAGIMPILTLFIMINLPGALVLYYATQSLVAILLQRYYLNKDKNEMVAIADENASTGGTGKKATAKARLKAAREAEVIATPVKEKK